MAPPTRYAIRAGDIIGRAKGCAKRQREIAAPLPQMCVAIILSSTLRNSALSLGSDRGAGTKGGERPVVGLDVGRGHRLTRSVDRMIKHGIAKRSGVNRPEGNSIVKVVLIEEAVRQYLEAKPGTLRPSLERLCDAIDREEAENVEARIEA